MSDVRNKAFEEAVNHVKKYGLIWKNLSETQRIDIPIILRDYRDVALREADVEFDSLKSALFKLYGYQTGGGFEPIDTAIEHSKQRLREKVNV